MTAQVSVSPIDVQRARLLVRLNQSLGETTPDYVIKIAEAKPAERVNGTARPVNGTHRPIPGDQPES